MKTRRTLACLALCATLCGWPAAAVADAGSGGVDTTWPAHLRRFGITPITPPTTARDFTLHDLQGRAHHLEAMRGDWVLLTFFATWCGPCASEMPSLEALYQQRKHAKGPETVRILGIATDPENDVRGFAQRHGMSFPVLLDSQGVAGRTYQASSIPTSYLIDPGGKLVGVTRGARDWRRMGGMFDGLPATAVTDVATDAGDEQAAASPAPVALPPDVMPPHATASLRGTPGLDVPFFLDVQVTWTGKSSDYILLPPEVHTPEAVEVLSIAAQTGSQAGAARIDYEVKLVAHQTGSFALDPVDIRYTPAGGSEPMATRLMGPTVQVDYVGLQGLWVHHGRQLLAGLAAVGVLTAAAVTGQAWRRKRQAAQRVSEPPDTQRYARAQAQLKEVQQSRMSGNVPAFLHQLLEIAPELDPPSHRKTLEALAEAAAYGNMRPDDEVLNQLERQAVRKVQTLAPGAQAWEQEQS